MDKQPPSGPDPYDHLFRPDARPSEPASPKDDISRYEDLFRDEPRSARDNRPMRQAPEPRGAATAAPERPPAARPPSRKRPLWRRLVRLIALLLVLLIGYVVFLLGYLVANINRVDAMPADRVGNTRGAVTLIVGSDERSSAPDAGGRTDTIMLLVDPLFGRPTLVSVPRDSWVDIPGRGKGKINAAFALGGPQLLIETIEQSTGLRVDHYVEVGFEGVVWITDSLGGLNLCIDYDVDDPNSGLVMEAGCSKLDGLQALAYVRMRYADPKGDLGRIARQQQYISSLIKTVLRPQVFLNPFTMMSVVKSASAALTVDKGTGVFNLARFGFAMVQVGSGSGEVTTVPVANPAAWKGGQSVVLWDDAAAEELFRSLGARR